MSLYADEEIGSAVDVVEPSQGAAQTSAPTDPLQALAAALTLPAESSAQAAALSAASARFEDQPDRLPELCTQLLPMVVDGGESLLRSWTLEMISLAVGRSKLKMDAKSAIAQSSLEALHRLLNTSSASTIKAVIPIFSTIHPILFKLLATSRPPQAIFELFNMSKSRILSLALDPHAQPNNKGVKAAAWKFVQKVLLAGIRAPAVDPRLQARQGGSSGPDPSIAIVSRDSPLNVPQLEEEAKMLQTQLVTVMFSSHDPAILQPIFHTFPLLCKSRPPLAALLIPSMAAWTPAHLEAAGRPAMQIRAVEKTMKMVMVHLLKLSALSPFAAQLNETLIRQKQRMDLAFAAEQEERKRRRANVKMEPGPSTKHPLEAESSADAVKRAKVESGVSSAEVDVTRYPVEAVIDIVMAGLQAVSVEQLTAAFETARRNLISNSPDAVPLLASALGVNTGVKEEEEDVLNPLEMDMDDEDEMLLAEPLLEEAEEAITLTEFTLPAPSTLETADRDELIDHAIERIWQNGHELASLPDIDPKDGVKLAVQPKEMWMLLMARLSTRGAERKNAIVNFVTTDFASRSKFASIWLNEEWYNDKLNHTSVYPSFLAAIMASLLPKVDAKDRSLSPFLSSLPELPITVIDSLASLCGDADKAIVGFLALRDLIEARPPVRKEALGGLLELCTHPDRKTRVMAIRTVSRWVPDSPMSSQITSYGLGVLRRLVTESKPQDSDVEMEDGEQVEEKVESKFLTEVTTDTVQQHVELAFALSRRHQDMLEDIFSVYPKLETAIAGTVKTLLTPLIQSLGPTPRLLEVLRHFPAGADELALHVVTTLSAEGASTVVANLVKGLMSERELEPRFIIPIIGELDKAEIEKQIPRIVSLLGSADSRDVVRTAFASALQKMTPADLLVALHTEESARKATIEAIGICFSMTTVFRSDVLATSLARITDLSTLPVVFLRTTIQAVTTYKSLVPFIANNILPKLVSKRIWEQPPLWDGFIKLARLIAPASYGSLLQLPKDSLRDVLEKQPSLKTGLGSFLAAKGQKNALAELLGEPATAEVH